jgi:hypothetical protein
MCISIKITTKLTFAHILQKHFNLSNEFVINGFNCNLNFFNAIETMNKLMIRNIKYMISFILKSDYFKKKKIFF